MSNGDMRNAINILQMTCEYLYFNNIKKLTMD